MLLVLILIAIAATALLYIKPIILALKAIPAMFDCVRSPLIVPNIDDEAVDLTIAQKLRQSICQNQVKRLSNHAITSYLKNRKQNDDQAFDSSTDATGTMRKTIRRMQVKRWWKRLRRQKVDYGTESDHLFEFEELVRYLRYCRLSKSKKGR